MSLAAVRLDTTSSHSLRRRSVLQQALLHTLKRTIPTESTPHKRAFALRREPNLLIIAEERRNSNGNRGPALQRVPAGEGSAARDAQQCPPRRLRHNGRGLSRASHRARGVLQRTQTLCKARVWNVLYCTQCWVCCKLQKYENLGYRSITKKGTGLSNEQTGRCQRCAHAT